MPNVEFRRWQKKGMRAVMMKKFRMAIFLLLMTAMATGCLELDGYAMHYDLDKNMRGKLTLIFYGVHSSGVNKEKEYREFVQGGYIKEGKSMAKDFGLHKTAIRLTNTTATKTDAQVVGYFSKFIAALIPMTEDGDYELKMSNKKLSVRLFANLKKAKNEIATISIRYHGKIVSHNAHHYDGKLNMMVWNMKKIGKAGIVFVLDKSGS